LSDIPYDECLTIIKPFNGDAYYNNSSHEFIKDKNILQASLYTNNAQVFGHKTK
jgi:hypothetical protein